MARSIRVLALLTSFYLLLPRFFFLPVQSDLDGSWVLALHLAVERGMVFGRDLFFTFGPLGVLATRLPIGTGIRPLLLSYDLFFYLNLLCVLTFALEEGSVCFRAAVLVATVFVHAQSLYFLDPTVFPAILTLFWLFRAQESGREIYFVFSLTNAVIAFFLKANFGLYTLGAFFGWILLSALQAGRLDWKAIRRLIYGCAAVGGVALVVGVALPGYVVSAWHFASAYADAMSMDAKSLRTVVKVSACIAGVTLFVLLYWAIVARNDLKQLFRAGVVAALVFLLWKQGAVRADAHIWIFLEILPIMLGIAWLFSQPRVRKILAANYLLAISTLVFLTASRFRPAFFTEKAENGRRAFAQAMSQPVNELPKEIPPEGRIPPNIKAAIGNETVDILPWDLCALWFNELNYRPRGVIQSYAAYDSYLDGLGVHGLEQNSAPQFLLIKLKSLDRRYWLFDEPLTKRAILENYGVEFVSGEDILLKRRSEPAHFSERVVREGVSHLGERIELPPSNGIVIFRVSLGYSFSGRARRIVFRAPELEAVLERSGGKRKAYRAVLPLLREGVPVSVWASTAGEGGRFFNGEFTSLERIRSIELDSAERSGFDTEFSYSLIELSPL